MPPIINLNKVILASRIQPDIFKVRRQLKASKSPDYVAVMKGSTIEMVCINQQAWEEYQNFKISSKNNTSGDLSDDAISDGFTNIAGKDLLSSEPPLTKEEYDHYMSL